MPLWDTHISAKHTYGWVVNQLDQQGRTPVEVYVDCFEDMIEPWYLAPARGLASVNDHGFASLAVSMAFIETLDAYETGALPRTKSTEDAFTGQWSRFRARSSGREQWPPDAVVYEHVRCGLFHAGRTTDLVWVHRGEPSAPVFEKREGRWVVCPAALAGRLTADVAAYIVALRAGGQGRFSSGHFETTFLALFGATIDEARREGGPGPAQDALPKTHRTGSSDH